MTVLLWIVRALVLLVILRLLLRALFPSRGRRPQGPASAGGPRAAERLGGELVRDPQCGTYIPKARALVAGKGSDAQYFCSTDCRDAYEKLRSVTVPSR